MDDRLAQLRAEAEQMCELLDARRTIYNAAIREINGKRMLPAEAEEFLARRMEELGGNEEAVDEERLNVLFDELADIYLDGGPRQQALILDMFAERRGLRHEVFGYLHRCAQQLIETRDERWLLRGLAGAVVEDAITDWRDTRVALAALYQAARKARVKPEPIFKRVAAIASNEARGHMSTRNILATFDRRAVIAATPSSSRR